MEEETNEKLPIYWSACGLFTMLSESEFRNLVMPFIKAYYKHHYGNELTIHNHDEINVHIYVHVERDYSTFYFHNDPNDMSYCYDIDIKNDHNDLTPENIFDFFYYEYKELFSEDSSTPKTETKKQKIIL